jgi:hypothetical protein
MTRPELQAKYMAYMKVSTSNSKAVDFLPPEQRKNYLTYPDNLKKVISTYTTKNLPWLIDHQEEMIEKWNAWISK